MAHGGIRQIHRLDSVTHNIANVNTPGFKVERLCFPSGVSEGSLMRRPAAVIDYSPGVMRKTGNVLDLAIGGKGFFAIQTKEGVAYTRDGRFTLDKDKKLVTKAGDFVLGRSGKIDITGNNIEINERGIITVDGGEVGALKIVDFGKPARLARFGNGLFHDPGNLAVPKEEENPEIQSGYLELSNVQAIKEMVEMIDIQRTFETYQKVMQTIQDQDKLSTDRIGRL